MAISPPRDLADPLVGEVRSEIGALRRVLVHRPGRELDRLTPANAAALLFDDVVWPDLARDEHDVLVATMQEQGVEVLNLDDLLAGAFCHPAARRQAIAAAAAGTSAAAGRRLGEWLESLAPPALASAVVEGTPEDEGAFTLAPMPNQMFVRDTSAWLGRQLVIGAASNPVRAREATLLATVLAHHPLFGATPGCADPLRPGAVEGGDLLCLSDRVALIGVGDRTSADGARRLARRLLSRGFDGVLVVSIPSGRSSIHLDCLLSVVDRDLVVIDQRLRDAPVCEIRRSRDRVRERPRPSLFAALASGLGVERLRVVEVADEREQWTLAANVLALAPGRVVAYGRNRRTNEALQAAGAEVLPVPGEELSRGRGGPRCLTCPLFRDAVPAG